MLRIITLLATIALAAACTTQKAPQETAIEFTDEEYERDYELKSQGLERVLGKSDSIVGHAIIPFEAGGTVDMYYYPNGIKGTGFATMELIQPDGSGPIPNRTGTYELVAFTKLKYVTDTTYTSPFNLIERRMCGTFTTIVSYALEAKLEPGETMEIPVGEGASERCIVFDEYRPDNKDFLIGDRKHGLLLVIEVFRDEMEYAMESGSHALLTKLKENGHYPYSDLDRESVLK